VIRLKNIRGERRLFEAIDRLTEVVSDQRERGWQENVDIRLDYQRRHMDTENAGGWTPLDDEYRLQKVEEVGAIPILQYTTRMYRSLTQEGAPDFVREEEADSLKVGSSDLKARWHHEGRGRLPQREVIVITDAEGRQHLEVIEENYAGIVRGLGFWVL
jgi:hypothetical protein